MPTDNTAAPKLTQELIRDEVRRYWDSIIGKDPQELSDFYAHECSVFSSMSSRAEPGRLAATRREREYFGALTVVRVQTSQLDVVFLGNTVAVASYNFDFDATHVSGHKNAEEHIEGGRASQVFALDQDGHVRIFHEHFSLPAK